MRASGATLQASNLGQILIPRGKNGVQMSQLWVAVGYQMPLAANNRVLREKIWKNILKKTDFTREHPFKLRLCQNVDAKMW